MSPGNALPLRRNRDFVLLQIGQLLSSVGTQTSTIAYPLLVLALTGSAARAGVVAFARALPIALFTLPAGLAADRWNRKWLMVGADAVRVVAVGTLAVLVLTDNVPFGLIPLVAFVEGSGAAVFLAAQSGALRAVVPLAQIPAAAATQTGRQAVVQLAGPPLGGALFGVARSLPFVVDALSYVFSTVSLVAMRTPFQEVRERDGASLRERFAEGFRFLWSEPFLRTTALLFGLGNFIAPGATLAIVVLAKRDGLSSGGVGALVAAIGASLLLGAALSSRVRHRLTARSIILTEHWSYVAWLSFLVWPNVYVLTACMCLTALVIPSTDSVVHGYRIAMTPDRLLGRAESVRATLSLAISPLGALTAGFLLSEVSPRLAVGTFIVFGLVLSVWATLSQAIRAAPSLDSLTESRFPSP